MTFVVVIDQNAKELVDIFERIWQWQWVSIRTIYTVHCTRWAETAHTIVQNAMSTS